MQLVCRLVCVALPTVFAHHQQRKREPRVTCSRWLLSGLQDMHAISGSCSQLLLQAFEICKSSPGPRAMRPAKSTYQKPVSDQTKPDAPTTAAASEVDSSLVRCPQIRITTQPGSNLGVIYSSEDDLFAYKRFIHLKRWNLFANGLPNTCCRPLDIARVFADALHRAAYLICSRSTVPGSGE